MSKEINDISDLANEFNMWTKDPEQIKLKNPVLNGMFHGGLPKGSVIQIAAQSGVGKSTLVLQISKELCELGYKVAYIDVEKGLNPNMLKSVGVFPHTYNKDTNPNGTFYIFREYDCGKINTLIQKLAGQVDVVILDSLGALDSKIYVEGGVDANNPKVRSRY